MEEYRPRKIWYNQPESWRLPTLTMQRERTVYEAKVWEEIGYTDGRSGASPRRASDVDYMHGFREGQIAAEEADNGFNPSIEGRQW